MEELRAEFLQAYEGREYWLGLKETYGIDGHCYLVMCPEDYSLLNRIAMENLMDFLKRKYVRRAVVLFVEPGEYYSFPAGTDVRCVQTDRRKMDCILKYYRLTQFAKNIVVISLERPFGNENIVGNKEITLTDYVKDAIYV